MKRFSKLLLTLLLTVCLTGCVKYNVNMEVKDDKSVNLEIIYGMEVDSSLMDDTTSDDEDADWFGEDTEYSDDENYFDDDYSASDDVEDDSADDIVEDDSDITVDDYQFLEDNGFKVEEFTEEKDGNIIAGVKITKTYSNIDDITSDKKVIVDFNDLFSEENADNFKEGAYFSRKGSNYVANFIFDFSTEGDNTDYSAYESMFDLVYKIKLPEKAKSSNATTISDDGTELTWDLKYGEKNEVNFEFSFNNSNILLIGGLIAVVVIGVVALLIVVISKKKKSTNNADVINQ